MGRLEYQNSIASNDVDLISSLVVETTKAYIYKDTRKRDYVEARSLFFYILKHDYECTLKFIQDYMTANGKWMNHATIIHGINNFENYARFNKKLSKAREDILKIIEDIKYKELLNSIENSVLCEV